MKEYTVGTHRIPGDVWESYYAKAKTLVKDADPKSFLTYVIFVNDGNLDDQSSFLRYVHDEKKKDQE
jgi:hypothetical protein